MKCSLQEVKGGSQNGRQVSRQASRQAGREQIMGFFLLLSHLVVFFFVRAYDSGRRQPPAERSGALVVYY